MYARTTSTLLWWLEEGFLPPEELLLPAALVGLARGPAGFPAPIEISGTGSVRPAMRGGWFTTYWPSETPCIYGSEMHTMSLRSGAGGERKGFAWAVVVLLGRSELGGRDVVGGHRDAV